MIFPEKNEPVSIVNDTKTCGVWDLINFANQGGVMTFDRNFSIICNKSSQKWCELELHQTGVASPKHTQQFNAKKIVRDTAKEKELRDLNNELEKKIKQLKKSYDDLMQELSLYKTEDKSTIGERVLEL